jgi:protein involved in polysaccharide export with SLBB domain
LVVGLLFAFLGGFVAVQIGHAQAPDEPDTSGEPDQSIIPEGSGTNATNGQTGATNGQTQTTTQEQQDQVTPLGQQGQPSLPGQQPPNSTMGTEHGPVMSAEQIIAILKEDPTMLAAVKGAAAQKLGIDPSTIADEEVFDDLRKDANLRAQATKLLNQQGYSTNGAASNRESPNELDLLANSLESTPSQRSARIQTSQREEPLELEARSIRNPYGNLPSLRDLYSQFPATQEKLKRFGSDSFRFGAGGTNGLGTGNTHSFGIENTNGFGTGSANGLGTGSSNQLPMDLPVGPDYVLGPGDGLVVNLWGGLSDRLVRTVDRQGQIALPDVGPVTVAGSTIADAQTAIEKALGTQFRNERVEISTGRLRTVRVYVVGDVQRPGAYDISSLSTPLNALYAAGGPTNRGSLRLLRQYRGDRLVAEIDLYDLLLRGVRTGIDRLLPGDTILVPPVGAQVSVSGMVRRPAIYELKGSEGLDEVLDLAGGVLVSASLKQIDVERVEAHQDRTMVSVDLPDDAAGRKQKLAAFRMQDGDKVFVPPILPYSEKTVFLEGHVYRPGKYPFREGMTINELLRSYQDVMPEPADHAEIVRLEPPDFRPKTISFSLSDTLVGNDSIQLQSFDVIRVFGRYDIDPPQVSIEGEVIRPGKYPLSRGMTVTELVNMAGGFRRSAYREKADLSSYTIQSGEKVLTTHRVVDLQKAMTGDKSADAALLPGDVVGVREMTGWQDIGASITLSGEVRYAGTYGIEEGERLSSILNRAGGFREDAYPEGAVLERVQVRELGEKSRQEMIHRLETTTANVKAGVMAAQEQSSLQQSMQQQQQQVLTALRSHPASARLVVKLSPDIHKWENTPQDIEVRAGDTLFIPKRPDFVMIIGQVYNQTAITFTPGRNAGWYLRRAGGVTQSGNKKAIFVMRADGSVVAHANGWSTGSVLDTRMRPGDSLIVPEKIYGGSQVWRNLLGTAQIMSSVALAGAAAGAF